MDKIFDLFKVVLLAHIETKTVNNLFHEKSQDFYELLFDCFHTISEKKQDIWEDNPADCDKAIQDTNNALNEVKSILETMIEEKQTVWMDNLLRWLVDKLEFAIWNAKWFIEEEEEIQPKKILLKRK